MCTPVGFSAVACGISDRGVAQLIGKKFTITMSKNITCEH